MEPTMKKGYLSWLALLAPVILAGCVTMQSHNETATLVKASSTTGDFKASLVQLDQRHDSADAKKELLYNMERGELLRLDRQYEPSTNAFLLADAKVNEWEEAAKTDPQRLLGMLGASVISERMKVYEGQDYEKVWLTTRLALNRISQSNFDQARVDVKRTHEREAVIAEFRAKETSEAEEEAKSKGAQTTSTELNGYPVESLNDPEVLALKNGYQNALSHYLAGFLYESLNESGLAAPGYRKAIELRPGSAILEEGLRGLDARSGITWKRRQRQTDVLFLVETGTAPARVPKGFTIPIPVGGGFRTVSISYPVIEASTSTPVTTLKVGDREVALSSVVDLNVMSRRVLKDEMPGMVLRGVTRAIAKGILQDQLSQNAGIFGSIIGSVASAVTEQADDRMWRMLPERVFVARAHLPPGEHKVSVDGRDFGTVKIDGQYAVVPLRVYETVALVGEVGILGKLPDQEPPPPKVEPPVKSKAKVVKKKSQTNTTAPQSQAK
jgi:hypothetical protein